MASSKSISQGEFWKFIERFFKEIDKKFDRISKVQAEVTKQMKETNRRFQETDRKFKETDRKFKETDRKFQETDRKFQETDRKFQETDRKFQETDRKFQETDKRIEAEWQKVMKSIGDLTGKWGQLIEALIAPGSIKVFQDRGIPVERMAQRLKSSKNGENMEVDLVLENGDAVIVVEIKSTLGPDDVKDFISTLKRFKEFFPQYANKKVFGAVAGVSFSASCQRRAYKEGLFVIVPHGDIVRILNDEKFKPKQW